MTNVEIISASAGTGKTTRLARVIAEAVGSGQVRPEAVLATTFTVRAAAELSERAREHLLQSDHVDRAQRLAAARIGTVNSVCGAIVQEFSFDHGLSPRVRVLDEGQAEEVLRQARSRAVTRNLVDELDEVTSRLREFDFGRLRVGPFDWQSRVREIIALARANNIEAKQLSEFAERSWSELRGLLGPAADDGEQIDRQLDAALERFQRELDIERDKTKVTRGALDTVRRLHRVGARRMRWTDWLSLSALKTGVKSKDLGDVVRKAAARHDTHPRLHGDMQRCIGLVFEVARLTLQAYQDHKRRLGVIDFVDQELFALHMLDAQSVRERLGEELDLVLVDEFQDTSPIQLAVFLRLAEIAPRSVWVGDPKQAIYGFRGADPALMEAAVAQLLRDKTPERLGKCYRSRPALVELTSDLFAEAFGELGFARALVEVEPGREKDAPGLGPTLERWVLGGLVDENGRTRTNADTDSAALAAGVKALLDDPEAQILDPERREKRHVRPGDIAVLCLKHRQCRALARELARLGLRAVVARPGLLATLEGRLAHCALRLWIDPRDELARAEVTRWLEYPEDGDVWLARLLEARKNDEPAFDTLEPAKAVNAAREGRVGSGVLAAFDAALAAFDLRERCLHLGDTDTRLGNLDALRSHAVAYVNLCRSEGLPCTLQGLLAHLQELAEEGEDAQASNRRPDAVMVSTWHGAKGLEWPITVLADLSGMPVHSALDVRLISDRDAIDLSAPLADRWIRFWPDPYAPKYTQAPLYDRLGEHPATVAVEQQAHSESLRLLYVGWTRARDRLVLATRKNSLGKQHFEKLAANNAPLLVEPAEDGSATWCGRDVKFLVRHLEPQPEAAHAIEPAEAYVPPGPREHRPATVSPSSIEGRGQVGELVVLGDRLSLNAGDDDMNAIGDAIHSFLAADRGRSEPASREALASGCLERFGVAAALKPADLVLASDRLDRWIDERFPGARRLREWPLAQRLPEGSLLRGRTDLVLETDAGFVVLDHKSFPGSRAQALERVAAHAGQLRAYADALSLATGRPIAGTAIHLPVLGLVAPVEAERGKQG